MEQNKAGDRSRIFYVPAGKHDDPPAGVPVEYLRTVGPALRGRHLAVDMSEKSPLIAGAGSRTVYHVHGVRQPLLISLTHGLRRRRLPYAVTCHSRYAHIFAPDGQVEYRKTAAYARFLERPILEKARYVHALTEVEGEEVRRLAPKANIVTVPNGVFSTGIDGAPSEPDLNPWASGFPVFGFFGRLVVEHKGLDALVEGFARYKRAGGAGTLRIMGTDDAARAKIAALAAAAGIGPDVTILGPQFGPAKNEVLKRWSFFAMPSRFDRMPLAALEAGLLGLPLMLTEVTGIHVEEHGAGLRIAAPTPEAVAAALSAAAALTPEQWRAQSLAAHRMVLGIADWTGIAERLRELYLPAAQAGAPEAARAPARAMA
jgi:glycosyltransferase involved in cell wall biosynthesis